MCFCQAINVKHSGSLSQTWRWLKQNQVSLPKVGDTLHCLKFLELTIVLHSLWTIWHLVQFNCLPHKCDCRDLKMKTQQCVLTQQFLPPNIKNPNIIYTFVQAFEPIHNFRDSIVMLISSQGRNLRRNPNLTTQQFSPPNIKNPATVIHNTTTEVASHQTELLLLQIRISSTPWFRHSSQFVGLPGFCQISRILPQLPGLASVLVKGWNETWDTDSGGERITLICHNRGCLSPNWVAALANSPR